MDCSQNSALQVYVKYHSSNVLPDLNVQVAVGHTLHGLSRRILKKTTENIHPVDKRFFWPLTPLSRFWFCTLVLYVAWNVLKASSSGLHWNHFAVCKSMLSMSNDPDRACHCLMVYVHVLQQGARVALKFPSCSKWLWWDMWVLCILPIMSGKRSSSCIRDLCEKSKKLFNLNSSHQAYVKKQIIIKNDKKYMYSIQTCHIIVKKKIYFWVVFSNITSSMKKVRPIASRFLLLL